MLTGWEDHINWAFPNPLVIPPKIYLPFLTLPKLQYLFFLARIADKRADISAVLHRQKLCEEQWDIPMPAQSDNTELPHSHSRF